MPTCSPRSRPPLRNVGSDRRLHRLYNGLGNYYTSFTYASPTNGTHSQTLTGDFSNGWNLYTSPNGINWTSSNFGASAVSVSGANPWIAFTYGSTNTPVAPPSEATLATFATATGSFGTPEPDSVALIAAGMSVMGCAILRRKHVVSHGKLTKAIRS